jgi:hypothetical protein
MSPPRQRLADPIDSVEVDVSFEASREVALRMKELVPLVRLRKGGCEISVRGKTPSEVVQKVKLTLEELRGVG